MTKIKVLQAAHRLDMGGTEKALQVFCKYLDKSKFEVMACGWQQGGCRVNELEKLGIPVIVGPVDLDAIVREHKIDICHVYRSGHHEPGSLPSKSNGWPKIVETSIFHDFDPIEGERIDCHLFMSEFSQMRYLQRESPRASAQYAVMYNPVDFEELLPRQKEFSYTIGRCSRADDAKWHRVCIDCLPKVFRKVPEAQCVIQGIPNTMRERLAQLSLGERVKISEPNVHVQEFYQKIDIFTHGARVGETFGSVIAEAMANKIPVVTLSTPRGKKSNAQVELVEDRVTGFVCRWSWQYANAVIELLRNHDLRARFARQGYEKAREKFEASRLTRKLESVYTSLMDGPHV
ncbi:glycosyltransferase family 4 protein [Candidatus Nitronereus thalassa]|uniref:Glycosyltransferase family 4 protein n=1 Tax=Candidatus Nitronereus thalassa TaxID=3020898 RepID=A0ABU3K605_9BACT|nr:glycosyltransferase family 4 protein [Candidatus Nitronereus thalassa]MDT7041799.1 glycosyltransferase family 4 protein [Candidatus Nitronereus thalassa]